MSYWIPVVVALGVIAIVALALIVRRMHTLPAHEPLEQDPNDVAAPLPLDVAHEDSLTARELEEERARDTTPAA
jgi:hypothetical protein